ncbi:DsbA family oxidoreductase [Vibrio fluminensis]|uniref:DsbA family oxidoreductase n=1 Tax=Vibrio fluminensis TaxID=2783614 RepID=UPI001887F4DB|nr:DsbA family oxidoreductase [Vibrio fluminensis]
MKAVQIDIVSDVVCPWCVIGFGRLSQALNIVRKEIHADIHWHPFELNPMMPLDGQNLRHHLAEKYGTSPQASESARTTLTQLGHEIGFTFHFNDDMRIYNTRKAHQLLMWSQTESKQQALQTALFEAYFTDNQDISAQTVLADLADSVGLERQTAIKVINDETWAYTVSKTEQQWLEAGINAVPALVFNRKHLVSGAQTVEVLVEVIRDIAMDVD